MAVSIEQAWAMTASAEPSGSPTIGSPTQGLLICCQTYEAPNESTVITFTVGGQTYDGTVDIHWENGAADQSVRYFWWLQATIDAMSGSAISYVDTEVMGKTTYAFATFDGVDQATPVTDENKGTDTSTDQLSLTTTSTTDDYDVVAVSRQSPNRNITSWGTLTEQWSSAIATTYWTGLAHDTGGTTPIVIDGDGIAADITYSHIIIHAVGGNMDLSVRGTGRGNMRGVARGIG